METDCIFPSPSFLSQHPHLSTPSGTMLLEARLSGGERDKWQRMQRLKCTRAWWITLWSQSHESHHNTANASVKEEEVFKSYLGHFQTCFEVVCFGFRSHKYSGRKKWPEVQHAIFTFRKFLTLVRHLSLVTFVRNVKLYIIWYFDCVILLREYAGIYQRVVTSSC